jgi:hypothetical protein
MKIKFTISSHINSYEKTYPVLVSSLLDSGVPAKDIYFFIGGSHRYSKIPNDDGINVFETDHNSIDFTGLISVLDLNLKSDYWFLLHDTCYVGLNFYNFISNFNHNNADVVKMYFSISMNIGSYKQTYLENIKPQLMEFKNQDYTSETLQYFKKLSIQKEDIFLNTPTNLIYNTSPGITEGPIDFYKNGSSRVIEHYNDIDVHKLKSNWFIKSQYGLNL